MEDTHIGVGLDIVPDGILDFLNNNYVEDTSNAFRIAYTKDFLTWLFQYPTKKWFVTARNDKGKLIGFILGMLINIQYKNVKYPVVEINFLCVHHDHRGRKVGSAMMHKLKEICRLDGYTRGVYTSANRFTDSMSMPFGKMKYHHRILNYDKALRSGFTSLPDVPGKVTLKKRMLFKHRVKDATELSWSYISRSDVDYVLSMLNSNMRTYSISQIYSKQELVHYLFYAGSPMVCFLTNDKKHYVSYYKMQLLNTKSRVVLNEGQIFHMITGSDTHNVVMQDLLVLARNGDIDIVNSWSKGDESHNFVEGTGSLYYHHVNLPIDEDIPPESNGLTMF